MHLLLSTGCGVTFDLHVSLHFIVIEDVFDTAFPCAVSSSLSALCHLVSTLAADQGWLHWFFLLTTLDVSDQSHQVEEFRGFARAGLGFCLFKAILFRCFVTHV